MLNPAPAPTEAPAPARIHGLGWLTLGSTLSITMTIPVTSLYLNQLGLPAVHIGGIIGALSLALVASELIAPGVSSWIGRRRTVVASVVGSIVTFSCFPLAGSLAALYATRLGLGAARGLLWPALFAEIAEVGSFAQASSRFVLFWLYSGLGQLIGPAMGGWLGQQVSLRAPFFAASVTSLATIAIVGAVRPVRDTSPNPFPSYVKLSRESPAIFRSWLVMACTTVVVGVYSTFLPLHAATRGITPGEIGLVFTGGGVAFLITQVLLHRVSVGALPERLLIPSFLARGVGIGITPWLDSFAALLAVNFATSLLGATIPPALTTRISARTPRNHMVASMGGINAAADAGFIVGPILGGILAAVGLRWAFALVPCVTLLALMLLVVDRDHLGKEASAPVTSG